MNLFIILSITFLALTARPEFLTSANLERRFNSAIDDSLLMESSKINTNLTIIDEDNSEQIFNTDKEVLAIAYIPTMKIWWKNISKNIGKKMAIDFDLWVTIFPDLKKFCIKSKYRSAKLQLRLKSLLGLKPNENSFQIVKLYINPKKIYRPCYNPRTDVSKCELHVPYSIDPIYKKWLIQNLHNKRNYPWTVFGYTYDYGNRESRVGLSEFVVLEGTEIQIEKIMTVDEFCQK